MVAVFAGLKWRLLLGRYRGIRGGRLAGLILGGVLFVVVLAAVTLGQFAVRAHPDVARVTATTLFTGQFVAWGLAPLIAFGVDETVDPSRFALLPLPVGTLQRGLLVTALVGYLPVANAVLLIGVAVSLSGSWALLPVALLAAAVQLLLCVVFSRAVATAMAGLLSGRRGRDLGVMVGFAVFVVYMAINYSLNSGAGADRLGRGATRLSGSLGWLPPGALAQLPGFLRDGDASRVAVAVVTVGVAAVLLWRWWAASLGRSLTTQPSQSENSGSARTRRAGGAVADSVRGALGLVAERDRILARRDPIRRIGWLTVAFFAIAYPFLLFHGHGSVYGVTLAALVSPNLAANCYGTDGSALWLHLVAFADRTRARGELLGHATVAAVPTAVILAVAVGVQAAARHDWPLVPGALGVCWAAMLGGVATATLLSPRLPFAVRQSRKSMFANSIPGQKGRTTASSFATIGGGAAVALPILGLALLGCAVSPAYGWLALVLGPVLGTGVLWLSSATAARVYLDRGPEILAQVSAGDRS